MPASSSRPPDSASASASASGAPRLSLDAPGEASHSARSYHDEDDEDVEARSSREDAGLVARSSSESERAARRARYERGGMRGTASAATPRSLLGEAGAASPRQDVEAAGDSDAHESATLHRGADAEWEAASEAEHFEDRRETGGWSARIKGRGTWARSWEIAREALPTLILAVFSLMFAGELLVHIARWPVFIKVDKLFILVPILLNLKGNLEMNLSLRMSTSANIGELDVRRTRETLIFGNLALLQVQALIVSAFAGVLAFVLGVMTPDAAPSTTPRAVNMLQRVMARQAPQQSGSRLSPRRIIHHHPKPPADPALRLRNGYFEFVLVIATGMLSASLSSAILGSFMCALVVVTRRMGGNPDNIASPLAASLGDLLTLTLLGLLASLLVHFEGTLLATVILAALIAACASCFVATCRNAYVRELLSSGWVPLLVAMFISSGAGLLLDTFVQRFEGFALLAPVVTGLPGACAAIFVSRTSTALHSGKGVAANLSPPRRPLSSAGGSAPPSRFLSLARLRAALPPPTEGWLVPCTLFGIGVGIETLFLLTVWMLGQMSFGWPFAICFVLIGAAGFAIALAIAHFITLALWARDYDPDIYSLPFVSSLFDVVGQALLVLIFALALALGDTVTAAVNAGEGHGGV